MDPHPLDFDAVLNLSADPDRGYAELHRRGSVVSGPGIWLVIGYDAAAGVLRDHTHFSSQLGMDLGSFLLSKTMVFVDPPDHTRLRGVVARSFTPRALATLEPRIREIARSLLDDLRPGEPFDVMGGLARPLPVIVIAEMLGLDTTHLDAVRWSDPNAGMMSMMSMAAGGPFGLFDDTIAARRRERRDDLISILIDAHEEGVMSQDELKGACALLFVAGNVTTTSLLGNAVYALAHHPDQCQTISAEPSLIPNALEEVFRYDPPVPAIPPRQTVAGTTIDGHDVPIGTNVIVYAGAANRDPKRFTDPERFDVARPDAASHLAFGVGIHHCLGAPLSRLEARVALEELLARVPSLKLGEDDDEATFDGNAFVQARRRVAIVV